MNCERTQKLLSFLHDGSLAPEIAREAGEHVEQCERCRQEYAELTRTLSLVRKSLEKRVPAAPTVAYREMVMRKIHKRKQERTVVSWAVPVAAAIFLVASVTSYSFFHGDFLFGSRTAGNSVPAVRKTETVEQVAPVDEGSIITTMYQYADVSVYDVLNNLDEDAWETAAGLDEVDGE